MILQILLFILQHLNLNHPILYFFKKHNLSTLKRADFLAQIASSYNVIAIAGTHGKTTISCMLSHILRHSGYRL